MADHDVVTRDDDASRYEIRHDGELAGFADVEVQGHVMVVPHTEIDPAFGGRGLGTALVRGLLDDARARGLKVRPDCPFVARYLDGHPEDADLRA